ncbi:MAG: hypothetical protein KDK03_03290 [Rhodobacteraceae bacterium]|nr:hypothetical protein [Paracoccaceae bacterium]
MAQGRHSRAILTLPLLAALSGCAALTASAPKPDAGAHVALAFEDKPRPDVLSRSGPAIRGKESEAAGLWGVVPRLPHPERALVENAATGASVVVALYSGTPGARGAAIRLSPEAADRLGLLDAPVEVRITALRREAEILAK